MRRVTVIRAALAACLLSWALSPARADGVVAGYVLAELAPTAGLSDVVRALYGDGEGEDAYVYDHIENTRIYALRVPAGEGEARFARRVARVPGVVFAETDTYFGDPKSLPFGRRPSPTGARPVSDFIAQRSPLDRMVAAGVVPTDFAWQPAFVEVGLRRVPPGERGKGVKVAVLDTGVNPAHPLLYGRCTQGYNALSPSELPLDLADGATNAAAGHGTMVASLITRVVPDADIVPVRVLNADGFGTGLSVSKGVRFAVEEGARVLNLSFSSATPSATLNAVLRDALGRGVLPVASAGNEGVRSRRWPAAYPGVLAVAALESDRRRADYSNFGAHIGVCAPGSGVLGGHYDGGYARWSGTSFAAPLVSGQAALLAGLRPERSGADVALQIRRSALRVDALNPLFVGQLGAGLIRIPQALW